MLLWKAMRYKNLTKFKVCVETRKQRFNLKRCQIVMSRGKKNSTLRTLEISDKNKQTGEKKH